MDVPNGPEQFPERLRVLRKRLGKSQTELAALCEGIPSARTLRRWELGEVAPHIGRAFSRLAEVLDVSPAYLRWGGEE